MSNELMFERYDDDTVVIKGPVPQFTRMTWEFIQASDPQYVKFHGEHVIFLDKVTYRITGVDDTGCVLLELLEDGFSDSR